ncbi:putative serine/threonine protein kinase [Blattamonas nauphoetae]|uniref:non-specific serine/threonine protein kinase n=1 Tax=Blattamonas nauphoetae TaxID=2049346 RepID=A0ABQ9XYR6_9EUKA|nr:putative serine/threonine protein kinase [Blattamonas nauphoetae]
MIKLLGQGSSGSVYLVEYEQGLAAVKIITPGHNIDGEEKYAVRFFEQGIQNPFYIRIRLTTKIQNQFILMMDYANLPALNHLMTGRLAPLPERFVGILVRQILVCIAEFSKHGYIHRDVKLDNVFLHFDGDDTVLAQVSDYGLLIPQSEAHLSKDLVGTPVYLAPEIVYLSPRFSHKSDVWAIGVMLYTLLFRSFPFQGQTNHQLYTSIQTITPQILRQDLSQDCRKAIFSLLEKDVNKRPTASKALELPFFKQFEEEARTGVSWREFAEVTSGQFPKPHPQSHFIPDTHQAEKSYRHLTPLRNQSHNSPATVSQTLPSTGPSTFPHNPNDVPSSMSVGTARPVHPLPKTFPKQVQHGARFPARQSSGPTQICEICQKSIPVDQMWLHKETEHQLIHSAPVATVPLPELVQKKMNPVTKAESRLDLVGLVNRGMQCYLNVVVQSLFHVPVFRKLILSLPHVPSTPSTHDPLHVGLHRLFQAMLDSLTPVNTSDFTQTIHFPQFVVRQMNDTQDFFNRLVNGLNSELKNTPLRGLASSLLSGRSVRKTILEQNGRRSVLVHPEHFWSLRMPIELGNGVEDVLPLLLDPDQRGNTQKFYSLPPVLFVDLVRWTSGERGLTKNNKRFSFPTSLDLSRLIEPLTLSEKMNAIQKKKEIKKAKGQPPSSQTPQSPQLQQSLAFNEPRHAAQKLVFSSELNGLGEPEKEQAWMAKQKTGPFYSQSFKYSLLAVEVHSGTLTMGHYYSFIRPLGTREWFECNDEAIRRVEEREAVEGQFGGSVNGREVVHSAMTLVYVQDCHVERIAMKESVSTEIQPYPDPHSIQDKNNSEIDSLRQQCEQLQAQLRQAEKNNQALNERLKNTDEEKRTTQNNLEKEKEAKQRWEEEKRVEEEIRRKENQKREVERLNEQKQQLDHFWTQELQKTIQNEKKRFQEEKEELIRAMNNQQETQQKEIKDKIIELETKVEQRNKKVTEVEHEMTKQETEHQRTIKKLEENDDYQHQLQLLEIEKAEAQTELKVQKRKAEDLERTVASLSAQIQNLKKENADMKSQLEDQKNEMEELRKRTHIYQSERDDFKQKFNLAEGETVQLRQRHEEQKKQIEVAERTAAQSEEKLKTEKEKTLRLHSELNDQNKDIDKLKQTTKKAEEDQEKLRREFENYKTKHQLEKGTLSATQEGFAQLEQNNQELRSEIKTLEDRLKESEEARKEEEEKNGRIADELRRKQAELKNVNAQLQQTNGRAQDLEAKWREAEQRGKAFEDMNKEMVGQTTNHNSAINRLTNERNQLESQLKNLEKDMNQLRYELEEQKRQSEAIRQTAAQSAKELQTEKEKTGQLQSEVDRRNKDIDELQQKMTKAEEIQREFENYKTKHQLEKGTLSATQERFAQLEQNNLTLGSEIRTLRSQLKQSEDARKTEEEKFRKKADEFEAERKKNERLEIDLKMATEANTQSKANWLEEQEKNKKIKEQHEREIQEQKQRHDEERQALERQLKDQKQKEGPVLASPELVAESQFIRNQTTEDKRKTLLQNSPLRRKYERELNNDEIERHALERESEAQKRIVELEHLNQELRNEASALMDELRISKERRDTLQKDKDNLDRENTQLKKEKSALNKQLQQEQQNLDQLQKDNAKTLEQLRGEQDRANKSKKLAEDAQTELKRAKQEHEKDSKMRGADLRVKSEGNQQLLQQLDKAISSLENQNTEIQTHQDTISRLNEKNARLNSEISKLKEQISGLERQIAMKTLPSINSVTSDQTSRNKHRQSQLESGNQPNSESMNDSRRSDLTKALKTLQEDYAAVLQENDRLKQDFTNQQQQIETLNEQRNQRETEFQMQLDNMNTTLRQKASSDLENQNKKHQKEQTALIDTIRKLENELNQAKSVNPTSTAKLDLQSQYNVLLTRYRALKGNYDELEKQRRTEAGRILDLQKENEQLKSQYARIEEKLKTEQGEVDRLRKERNREKEQNQRLNQLLHRQPNTLPRAIEGSSQRYVQRSPTQQRSPIQLRYPEEVNRCTDQSRTPNPNTSTPQSNQMEDMSRVSPVLVEEQVRRGFHMIGEQLKKKGDERKREEEDVQRKMNKQPAVDWNGVHAIGKQLVEKREETEKRKREKERKEFQEAKKNAPRKMNEQPDIDWKHLKEKGKTGVEKREEKEKRKNDRIEQEFQREKDQVRQEKYKQLQDKRKSTFH